MATITQRYKKLWRKNRNKTLIPSEWLSYPTSLAPYITPFWKPLSREDRQAYFAGCYGNVYGREKTTVNRGHPPSFTKTVENHMFLSALVGNGHYTSISWLDLQTNKKWDEQIYHAGSPASNWFLMSELKVEE